MKDHSKQLVREAADPILRGSSTAPASLLFFAGRSYVVGYGGSAERELLERGALRIGMVLFTRPTCAAAAVGAVAPLTAEHLDGRWGSIAN